MRTQRRELAQLGYFNEQAFQVNPLPNPQMELWILNMLLKKNHQIKLNCQVVMVVQVQQRAEELLEHLD